MKSYNSLSLYKKMLVQWRVMSALIIRDLSSRFFGKKYGFLLVLAWPLSHILLLVVMSSLLRRSAPYGDSAALWYATGVIPFMAFSYMSRFLMQGAMMNKPLLAFPVVKLTDILFSRAIFEVLSIGIVVIVASIIFVAFDISIEPQDLVQAANAILACIMLGMGLGVVNAVIAMAVPLWMTVYTLTTILLWILSGVMFVPATLPSSIVYWLSFNPAFQGVEWMRSAYYEGYDTTYLDKQYLILFSLCSLFFGLLAERLFRGRLLK